MSELAIIAANPAALDEHSDPGAAVVRACENAKAWLVEALEHGDIEQIVELKGQAEAIRVYTLSKQLGEDAALSAAEVVRRAERGIGVAIRKGQSDGRIAKPGDIGARPAPRSGGVPGAVRGQHLVRPSAFVDTDELSAGIYPVTDGVSNEQFETAIQQAKEEKNLSRANVVRRVKEPRTEPIAKDPKPKDRRKRRPITDVARDNGWALRKNVERLERLCADDRFRANKEQVAAHLRGHLTYAAEMLRGLLDQLNEQGEV